MLLLLATVGWFAPLPEPTDRGMMEKVGRGVIVRDCADLNCFRILVPATLEALPGPSMLRWRGFAAVANTAAAMAAAYLALELGLSPLAATLTAWLSAVGAGSFSTIYHPYNADPFVLALAPVITMLLMRRRWLSAVATATIGILAKEFAAAPLYISAAASAIERRWRDCGRQFLLAIGVTAIWLVFHLILMRAFNYSYNDNPSSRLFSGGYLRLWLSHVPPVIAAYALFGVFGAAWLLLPFGWIEAPAHLKRLALGSIPAALALAYVATPERALWNFFFLVLPIAAIALSRLPVALAAVFVALFGLANLRLGAQMPGVPDARYALALTLAIALVAAWHSRNRTLPSRVS